MKLTIYTLATDDDNGTHAQVFGSQTERDDALLAWGNSDREEWATSDLADDLHEYFLGRTDYLDTFSTDEQEVEIDPAALITVNEAWKLCKDSPGAFGNLYDPEEVMSILDGWAEEGDTDETSYWFDPDCEKDRMAILAWCEAEGPDFEDQVSNLVCSNLPNRGAAFAALDAKKRQEHGMNTGASTARRIWKAAQLFVGFHRDPKGKMRDKPYVWSPKNGRATLHRDAQEQETFVVMKSADGDADQDIQIKLRPDMIVLRRDFKDAWEGVKIDAFAVSVKVGGLMIRVNRDGSIIREDDDSTTWVEADGGVLKKTEFIEASMSGDGREFTRRTPDHLAAITPDGVLSKER